MIRINLLPVKDKIRKQAGIVQLWLMAAVLVIASAGFVGINIKYANENSKLEDGNRQKKAEIKRLEDLIGEVNELEKDRARLQKQIDVIDTLEKGRTGPVKMLDALAEAIPKRVWITDLSESGQQISLSGFGVENADISDFMAALEATEMFSGVNLKFTEQTKSREFGQPVFKFKLTMTANYKG